MDNDVQISHYHANMAALLLIADWCDMLREEGVYDNTRIILAADHGRALGQFDAMRLNEDIDVEAVNPLLMIKDFGATGFTKDESFMCNADVPILSMKDIITDPMNPYTGIPMNGDRKKEGVDVAFSNRFGIEGNYLGETHYAYDSGDEPWYSVKDNIFDINNWKKIRDRR